MRIEISAGIVLYYIEKGIRKYLLLHYPAGHWDLPKGHIESGETRQETAQRELLEETGLHATLDPKFEYTFSYYLTNRQGERVEKTVIFFLGTTTSTDVTLSHEHQGYRWLPYQQARELLTYANAQKLLDAAEQHLEKE